MKGFTRSLLGAAIITFSTTAAAASGSHAHWGYKGEHGPNHWGKLSADFGLCANGKEQSPIDISTKGAEKAQLPAIEFNYGESTLQLVNNGHTVQANIEPNSYIKVGNDRYDLVQFHFHTPSEERINGKSYDMDAHLVHKNAEGKLAVVGVLLETGKENGFLKQLTSRFPTEANETRQYGTKIKVADLLPAQKGYYTFAGSLTTPPCSEGVRWLVLKQPVSLSKSQLQTFKQLFPMNARPVQPINARKVLQSAN